MRWCNHPAVLFLFFCFSRGFCSHITNIAHFSPGPTFDFAYLSVPSWKWALSPVLCRLWVSPWKTEKWTLLSTAQRKCLPLGSYNIFFVLWRASLADRCRIDLLLFKIFSFVFCLFVLCPERLSLCVASCPHVPLTNKQFATAHMANNTWYSAYQNKRVRMQRKATKNVSGNLVILASQIYKATTIIEG